MNLPLDALTPKQNAVAARVLAEAGAQREHIVVALSGAHAYGFPSPDSDLDLKAIHVAPTAQILGLASVKSVADRMEVIEGVEVDYTSNEIHGVLLGILSGNGNYAERVLGRLTPATSPENASLAPLVERALSKRLFRHYHGFAASQLKYVLEKPVVTAKKVLYVLRTALTGAHVLRTGHLIADLRELAAEYGFADALPLIEAKRAGERTPLDPQALEYWKGALGRAFDVLEAAHDSSVLPEDAPNRMEFQDWLIDLRRGRF